MFSGIVEEMGTVRSSVNREFGRIAVAAPRVLEDARVGDSVSVSGACLTITEVTDDGFAADVSPETLSRTTLGRLAPGDTVNLERALALGDRVGGHLMTGHVDAMGTVAALRAEGNTRWVTIDTPPSLMHMIAPKGSIAVDGISLTVVDVFETAFTVMLIPHTNLATTAGRWQVGSPVNLEVDLTARYIERQLSRDRSEALV